MEIQYLLSIINWDVVRFAGKASGRAVMNNVMAGGMPNIRADLSIANLSIQEGPLGDANISARWDKEVDGITMTGRIIDLYKVPDGLTDRERNITGITTLDGWVSPSKNDICLNVNTHNTNAAFLHGFLRGVFKEITGYVTGPISIIGPLNNVNIVGDAVPNINLRLRATNVPYHIEGDTLHFRPYLFDFQDISIYDRFGHRSTINGQLTHRNMKNFPYHFKADLHELLAYDEKEFNSDKFMATVFTDGELSIDGSDGHPLYVNAHITPTRGSVFAYDAATPDAITGNSFIEFRDRDSLLALNPDIYKMQPEESNEQPVKKDSLTILKEAKKNYDSDIFLNFDINLTPDCEVKLRMDNIEDGGYMSTFGHAALTAKWYNKGSFQLFGNYNIQSGSYRLYLQD
ncbi:MAG: translocation/assembly module TamB, partial [Bacteroidaceae bacterium]|nr:translocation/assembly module TamB [Bacteroidaceae bacterium]